MDKNQLSLAMALNMITELEKKSDERLEEINTLARGQYFQGKAIGDMTPNRLLYFISTHGAMKDGLRMIVDEYELDKESAWDLTEVTENNEVISKMEGILVTLLEIRGFEKRIKALRKYTKTFDEADYKRIRKEESLKILKELQIV